jgi:hypothetical protein
MLAFTDLVHQWINLPEHQNNGNSVNNETAATATSSAEPAPNK